MADPIQTLIGMQLASIEFVHDYIQLRFDGPVLTINAPFQVYFAGHLCTKGSPGYRDALCERIGHTIIRANAIQGQQLSLEFDDDSKLTISLRSECQVTAEAAVLKQDAGDIYVW
jgi:hypothetical protein